MDTEQEKTFGEVREQLTYGFLSAPLIHRSISIIFLPLLFIVGIASYMTFASDSRIGWEGLSSFWQNVYYAQIVYFTLHLLVIIFCRVYNKMTHLILLISFIFIQIKIGLDLLMLFSIASMDKGIYEDIKLLLLGIIIIGVLVHIFYFIHILRSSGDDNNFDANDEESESNPFRTANREGNFPKSYSGSKISFSFLFLLIIVVGFIFRSEIFLAIGELLLMFSMGVLVYIGVMIASVYPAVGLYCFMKFPSFRDV